MKNGPNPEVPQNPCFCALFILVFCLVLLAFHYYTTNQHIKVYRDIRSEWIATNEERNSQVYTGNFHGIFSFAKIITYESITGGCSSDCFEIICFHNFKVVESILMAERVPIPDGVVCPLKPSEHLAERYKNGEITIVIHNVDPAAVDTLRDSYF